MNTKLLKIVRKRFSIERIDKAGINSDEVVLNHFRYKHNTTIIDLQTARRNIVIDIILPTKKHCRHYFG